MHEHFVATLCIQNPVTSELIDSIGIIYCDDEIDVGPVPLLEELGSHMSNVVRISLGDDAVNESKDIIAKRATTLGILSDFENKLASPGFRASLKLVYVFFKLLPLDISTSTRISLRLLQAIGQLAYRYAT